MKHANPSLAGPLTRIDKHAKKDPELCRDAGGFKPTERAELRKIHSVGKVGAVFLKLTHAKAQRVQRRKRYRVTKGFL